MHKKKDEDLQWEDKEKTKEYALEPMQNGSNSSSSSPVNHFTQSTQCLAQWVAHPNGITCMKKDAFNYIWTCGRDRTVRIWDRSNLGILIKKIKVQDVPNCIHSAENHVWIASLCKIRIFDAEKQQVILQVDMKGYVCDMVDVDETVWVSCSNGSVQVYPHSKVTVKSQLANLSQLRQQKGKPNLVPNQ